MKVKTTVSLMMILTLGLLTLGCEDKVSSESLFITPADGTTSVARATEINVEFSEAMDKMSCESRFALFMGNLDDMPEDFNEGIHGSFDWDSKNSMMTFHPESELMDSAMYTICLKEGMEMHGNGGRMAMSGMQGCGTTTSSGVISKFEIVK